MLVNFQHKTWILQEIERIGRARFDSVYWPALERAAQSCLPQFSCVIKDSNKDKALAGFLLVCPPSLETAISYRLPPRGLECLEIAFVAVDTTCEGRGLAHQMLTYTTHALRGSPCWLHVDTINPRAKKLYESYGFTEWLRQPDPYGSDGYLMILAENGWNTHSKVWPTLFNTGPCETKQALCGGIFAPPLLTSRG